MKINPLQGKLNWANYYQKFLESTQERLSIGESHAAKYFLV